MPSDLHSGQKDGGFQAKILVLRNKDVAKPENNWTNPNELRN